MTSTTGRPDRTPQRPVRATYRVQLHRAFDFTAAASIAPYLADLGVSHLYCSPYLTAVPGSTHGYDVADPTHLNPELGGAPGHAQLVGSLRRVGLGQILDIVPNHMAADPAANRWWWDVLENGPSSPFAAVFDIDWDGGDRRGAFTVLVPLLGDHYGRVLQAGDLQVTRCGARFRVRYFDHQLPVSPRTLDGVVARAARRAGSAALAALADGFAGLPEARLTDPSAVHERHERKEALAAALAELLTEDPGLAAVLDAEVAELNRDADRLDALLQRQNYRLAYWRAASEELDYRRFFNIETLVGVRVEDPAVFELTHRLVLELVRDGTLDGLRVDHVDGLRDPAGYLQRLRRATGGCYTVVEKILEPGEVLPAWPVGGTSGYDFLNRVNNLFVDPAAESAMTGAYEALTGETASYQEVVHDAKLQVMGQELAAEVERLVSLLATVCSSHRRHRDYTRRDLRHALREIVAHVPVYRTYAVPGQPAPAADRRWMAQAVAEARRCRPDVDPELLGFVAELGLGEHPGPAEADFTARLQQLTAPVMAKGVEDTAFYRYHRLISLNEVGGDPGRFGRPVADFHRDTAAAGERWPQAMLTLSTHDTKRSADVRARINALSELPDAWADAAERWAASNQRHHPDGWADRNAEYLFYQTVVGAWPLEPDRAVAFMAKATKEAKVRTSWTDPDPEYDQAVEAFVRGCLADPGFLANVAGFLAGTRLVERGRRSSLVQAALLLTCPGVADLYQGTELWDLSLVDPDNRRPVDYDLRRRALAGLTDRAGPAGLAGGLEVGLADDDLGICKLWLTRRLLADRREHPDRYAGPGYEPLAVEGSIPDCALAFRRPGLAVVAACRHEPGDDSVIHLPGGSWRDLLTGAPASGTVAVRTVLARLPVAVLEEVG